MDVDPAAESMDFDDASYNYFEPPFKTEPEEFGVDDDDDQFFQPDGSAAAQVESDNNAVKLNGGEWALDR